MLTVFLSRGADDLDGDTIAACRLGVRRHLGPRWSIAPACPSTYAPARVQVAGERYEAFVTARDSLAVGAKLRQEISEDSDPVGAEKRQP